VLIDPEAAKARVVIGAIETAPIVLGDASLLFGGRVTGNFKQQFDAHVADALLLKAGVTNAVDRHIHGVVLRRAIDEAAA
jgi:carbon-monoxide dehydrogenase medium subunit